MTDNFVAVRIFIFIFLHSEQKKEEIVFSHYLKKTLRKSQIYYRLKSQVKLKQSNPHHILIHSLTYAGRANILTDHELPISNEYET